ncbi:ATP synthase F1 subcomplex gamma subunit [Longilinea arvoryzae]|uniref:ATP synthase gamma chain n=1 Tax=Longilinea arvoryzae TaxID=360412 RepID=A0A0S7BJ95_9CHLR|nr:ATP synthase F1 subunit gamma [Longilinea arvoryzae]GAP14534.1 ATP synthase F1 subcomplex gamma subunit [Longilinea arvoryzae]
MPSAKEMRLRIRSVRSLSHVTKALETVSASKVRKAVQAENATRPYTEKAWKVLVHLARQPGHTSLHPLLVQRAEVKKALVILITSDRGLAGSYNVNVMRQAQKAFGNFGAPVEYIAVGRKGRDMLMRRGRPVMAEFSDIQNAPTYAELSAVGHLAIDEYLKGEVDQVYVVYTEFINMMKQEPVVEKLLPLDIEITSHTHGRSTTHPSAAVFSYEPDEVTLLSEIIPRFTALQVYQAVLSSQASEHAARMVAMRNATDSARDIVAVLEMEYNKARQQAITNEMLDIAGGANALAETLAGKA